MQSPSASLSPAAIIAFTLGILAICELAELPRVQWLSLAALPAFFPWRGRSLWAMAMLGALLAAWQGQRYLDERWPAERHGEEIELQGHIASLPERSDEHGEQTWRFIFEPAQPGFGHIRASWYRADQVIRGAECWRLRLRLRTPHGSLNPGGSDYEGWLFRQGIGATATVREGSRCENSGGSWLLARRQTLSDRLNDWIAQPEARALTAAFTTGDQSGLSDHDWDVFRVTGTSHLVAVSGFNIAIVGGFAFFLIRWLWSASTRLCLRMPAQRAAMIGSAILTGLYAALAGFEPPVARAWLMLMVLLAATWTHRIVAPSRIFALAWLVILLGDPFAVLAPGLWLSFGAVAVILYVSSGRVQRPGALRSMVQLQLVLSLAMVPLTLYFFQGAAWVGPLVNLIAVPIVAVMTPVLLVALGLAAVAPGIGLPALKICALILVKLRAGLEWCASVLPHVWIPASPPAFALLLALIGAVLLIAPRGLPLRPLGLLCLIPLFLPAAARPSSLVLTMLDVGQGLSVVVQTQNHAMLFDAGPAFEDGFDAGASVVAPYLLRQGIHRLDLLMLSHGDNDHAGGIPAVRKRVQVAREIGTDAGEPCHEGIKWEWDGVRFETLHPDRADWSRNNSSCVLKIEGVFSALLPGDIEAGAEKRLLSGHPDQLKSDVLIAPHHGSKTSSTMNFVQAVKPGVVLYGAGWRNHFRHPRPEVVQRFSAMGAQQFITGNGGALRIEAGSALAVEVWRDHARHFWNAPAEPFETAPRKQSVQ